MTLAARLRSVQERVQAAALHAGRDPSEITLIAVSKTQPLARLVELQSCGQLHFGESYAQELRDKSRSSLQARWHYLGRLQSNKAKYVAPVAYRVHALETVAQAQALVRRAPAPLRCLMSVKLGGEQSKGGVPPSEALSRCAALQQVEGIEMVGLMCLPPFQPNPADSAPYFAELADLAAQGRDQGLALHELSMGMSHDFEVAIAHGATWVRVGTAIFGPRPTREPAL